MKRKNAQRLFFSLLLPAAMLLTLYGCLAPPKKKERMPELETLISFTCAPENIAALRSEVRHAFSRVAAAYLRQTGEKLLVTSGKRSLRHCAALMAGFSRQQLEGMYCRNGYPDYIRSIVQAQEKQGGTLTADQVYQILQKRQGGYISWHLVGAAIDISSQLANPELLRKLLQEHGFSVFDEQVFGVACIHATFKGLKPEIIRE
jgi:hypothetical protein